MTTNAPDTGVPASDDVNQLGASMDIGATVPGTIETQENASTLQVVALISADDLDKLNTELQGAVERAAKNRKAAAFARGAGVLSTQNDPIAEPILTAIDGVLVRFFDDFFSKNPSLDKKLKDTILKEYKTGLETVARAFATSKNPEESNVAREKLVEKFLDAFKNNPELRKLQIGDLSKDLHARMQKAEKMRVGGRGKPDRQHGAREGYQNKLGLGIILAEALATGYAMSNGIENYAFKEGIGWLQFPGASYLPGGLATFFAAIGGQAVARETLRAKKPEDTVFGTWRKNGILQIGAFAVALGLGGITYYDYKNSKSALGVGAATSAEVKGRVTTIEQSLEGIAASNKASLGASVGKVDGIVGSVINNEGNRGGAYLIHALKLNVLTGGFKGANANFSSDTNLVNGLQALDTKKGTKLADKYKGFRAGLGKITYAKNAPLQALLQDPNKSYTEKMSAIASEYNSMFAASLKETAGVKEKASQRPNLNVVSMFIPSQIGAFPNGAEAESALKGVAQSIGAIPAAFAELKQTEIALAAHYKKIMDDLEKEALIAFAGNAQLSVNTLPGDMNLSLPPLDLKDTIALANSPLGKFPGIDSDTAMELAEKEYGPDMRKSLEAFIMARAGIFVLLIALTQIAFLLYSLRRRSKNAPEIDAVSQECLKQIGVITDTLYIWANDSLGKLIKRTDDKEVMSRAYCEHIVWSWLIKLDPVLTRFAPPTYLGEGEKLKGKLGRAGEWLWEMMTGDIRPQGDRRTERLYKIFRDRINSGVLMTEKDTQDILAELGLGGGDDIVERVQKLSDSITAGNIEYGIRSGKSEEDATYIENANDSLILQKAREIKALENTLQRAHVTELQNLGNKIVSGEFPPAGKGQTIASEISTIAKKYDAQKLAQVAIIDRKYQLSAPVPSKKIEASKKSFLQKLSEMVGSKKQPAPKKIQPTVVASAPVKNNTIIVPPQAIVPVAQITSSMASLESRLKKHAATIAKLSTKAGRDEFVADVLNGSALVPQNVLVSGESISKYKDLLKSVDAASVKLRETRGTMDGVTDIKALETILLSLSDITLSRNELLASHGSEFQKWIVDITQLLSGLDALEGDEKTWEKPKVETVVTEAVAPSTVAPAADAEVPTLTEVVHPPVVEGTPALVSGSPAPSTIAPAADAEVPTLTEVVHPPVVEGTPALVSGSPAPGIDGTPTILATETLRQNLPPFTLDQIGENGIEVTFQDGSRHSVMRDQYMQLLVTSLDQPDSDVKVMSLDDLNKATGRIA